MNRIKNLITVFAFSLLVLALPLVASAQWRNDRNNGGWGGYGNNNGNLNSTIRNLKNRARSFASRIDRELDRSRYDDSRREDRLNDLAREFRGATDDLDDEYDNRSDYNDSYDEVRRVVQLGNQIDRALNNTRLSYNIQNEWNQIRQDLRVLENAYNNRNNNNNRNRRNDRNDRDDDWNNRNRRNDRNNRNNGRRNFPFPF